MKNKKIVGTDEITEITEDKKDTTLTDFLEIFLDENEIRSRTELTQSQINEISGLWTIANMYDLKVLKNYLNSFMVFMLSKNRKSRKEILEFFREYRKEKLEEKKSTTLY